MQSSVAPVSEISAVEQIVDEVCSALQGCQFDLSDERRLQQQIAARLDAAGVAYQREVVLGDCGTIDFVVSGLGIEVKIKGRKRAVYRQCKRYLDDPRLEGLLLLTNLPMGMPPTVAGKPVFLFSLGRAHL